MKKEEILANCIEEIRSGKSTIEQCVSRHPKLGEELRSLLQIATSLKPDEVTPSLEFKQRAKRRLLAEIQPLPEKVSASPLRWYSLSPVRLTAGVLIALLVLAAAGGSTVYAAQSSLPGDVLYPVKTGAEDIQLAVTWGTEAKADLRLKLAQRRIDEATQQAELNRTINVQALDTVERQFNDAIKELSGSNDTAATNKILSRLSTATLNQQVQLQQALANAPEASKPALKHALEITRRGNLVANVAYANHDFLERQPSVLDQKLDAGQFNVDGTLLTIQNETWNVGGVIIENVHSPGEVPPIGSRVKLEGLVKGNEVFITRLEVSEGPQEPTKVEGQFEGTHQNGTADIAGISVKISDNTSAQLKPGDKVQLQGDHANGKLDVTNKESKQDENREATTLNGNLMAVNVNGGTITIESAGSQTVVNVTEAQIGSDSGRALNLSDLNHLIGQYIRLDSVYKKGGLLFARQVRVEVEEQNQTPSNHNGHRR
jgi:hypothetical protein